MKIFFGPAGTPTASTLDGVRYIKEHGLSAMEVEFVRGVKMTNRTAKLVGELAKQLGIRLSVHAPYYINLNSEDKAKIRASKKRILLSCERAHYMHAEKVIFHPAYYGKSSKEEAFEKVKEAIFDMHIAIKKNGWHVQLAPETTGKHSAFGDLSETLKLVKETNCSFCLDLAHLKARENGKIDFKAVLDKVRHFKHLQCHYSGINFTAKGERNHILTDMKEAKLLMQTIKKYPFETVTIINESPDPFGDALKMQKLWEGIK